MTDYQLISADSHVIEPHDLWQRHIDREYRDRAPRLVHDVDTDRIVMEEIELGPIGLMAGCKRSDDEVRVNGRWDEDVVPGGYDPKARIEDLDVDGVDAEILFPTVLFWMYLISDDGFRRALFSAYNTWVAEFCDAYPDRLKGIAVLDPDDVDKAITEVQRAKGLGLVGAMLPLYSPEDSPYHDERYDPLWTALCDAGFPVNLHTSTSRRKEGFWKIGAFTEQMLREPVYVQHVILDMIFAGVFDRFPQLKVVSVENDIGWAAFMLERADYWWHRNIKVMNTAAVSCLRQPSDYFHRNVSGTFMRDRTAILASEVIGPQCLMWGNDFPHTLSTWPHSKQAIDRDFAGQPAELRQMITCDNVRALYGF